MENSMHTSINISVTVAERLMHLPAKEKNSGSNPFCDSYASVTEWFRYVPAKDSTVVRICPEAQQGMLAQLVEHGTLNLKVVGSNPSHLSQRLLELYIVPDVYGVTTIESNTSAQVCKWNDLTSSRFVIWVYRGYREGSRYNGY